MTDFVDPTEFEDFLIASNPNTPYQVIEWMLAEHFRYAKILDDFRKWKDINRPKIPFD